MKTEAEKREYNRQYYAKKKAEINRRRRERYWEDEAHRKGLQDAARTRYRTLYSSVDKHAGYTVKRKDGVPLFSIQYAAGVMGRSPEMIRAWEKNGLIPKTSYTDSRGWRLYTSDQIDLLGIAIKNFKSKQWDKDMVKKFLFENWQRP